MADENLVQRVRELGDIDLAALLCLINREHCIISTDAEYLDDLTAELELVASHTFGLASAVVDCTPETTLSDLVTAIQQPINGGGASTQSIVNVILARNLDTAPKAVQIQCLELMRTRRIFTRTATRACPKQFLLVAVLGSESAGRARLTKHLNDHFYISHWQDPEDGFPHLDAEQDEDGDAGGAGEADNTREGGLADNDTASQASSESVVRRTRSFRAPSTLAAAAGRGQQIAVTDWAFRDAENPTAETARDNNINNSNTGGNSNATSPAPLFTETDVSSLSTLSLQTHVDIEVQRYQMNIIAFLRLHRAVTPGSVPPTATTHLRALTRSLAALHGLDFATLELVQLAARKIYAHRIVIVAPERERSMQWGSDLAAVEALLEDVQPEDVIEDVLGTVDVPL